MWGVTRGDLRVACELLGVEPVFTCESPYGGLEAWWDLDEDTGRCRASFTIMPGWSGLLLYTKTRGLPCPWSDWGSDLTMEL